MDVIRKFLLISSNNFLLTEIECSIFNIGFHRTSHPRVSCIGLSGNGISATYKEKQFTKHPTSKNPTFRKLQKYYKIFIEASENVKINHAAKHLQGING